MVWFEKNFIPVPKEYTSKEGLNFATQLAGKTQFISLLFNMSGWVLIMMGILLGVAGSVLGTDALVGETDAWTKLFSQRGLICNTFAVIIAGVGRQFLGRAKAAATLASIATKAIASSSKEAVEELNGAQKKPCNADRVAYDACVCAKAIWLEGRVDDTQLKEILNKLGQETNSTPSSTIKRPSDA